MHQIIEPGILLGNLTISKINFRISDFQVFHHVIFIIFIFGLKVC